MPVTDFAVALGDLPRATLTPTELYALADASPEEQARAFAGTITRNPAVSAVLERLSGLDLPPWYLTAGSLFQSVWNAAAGHEDLNRGIRDHDLFFHDDTDLSYEAEDRVIRKCLRACEDLGVELEPRNQARVHLWYGRKFGKDIAPYRSLEHAISSFAATCCCVAVNLNRDGLLTVHSTHGFTDLFALALRPNPMTVAPRQVYEDKAARWTEVWPALTKLPWPRDREGTRESPGDRRSGRRRQQGYAHSVAEPFVNDDVHHLACGICPSRRFPAGEFDVRARPSEECPFDPQDGHRYAMDGTPVCVHPEKVGLPVGAYRSGGAPLTVELILPPDPSRLVPYLRDVLHATAPVLLESLIEQASEQIRARFPELDALMVLRKALN